MEKLAEIDKEPPEHLSERAKALWRELVPRRIDAPETATLLRAALESLDLADECREIIRQEGLTIATLGSGTVHRHPLLQTEKEARAAFHKAWTSLNLNFVPYSPW